MINLRRRSVRLVGAGLLAATSLGVLGVVANVGTVHADPAWEEAGSKGPRAGVGSDTIEAIFDAYTGEEPYSPTTGNAIFYAPLHSSAATNNTPVQSFDAIDHANGGTSAAPGCIPTKINGPLFDRPNGSSNGITALNDANTGALWQASTGSCSPATSLTGQVDFARSSRGPKDTTGNNMTWIPFAEDGVAYAYFDNNTGEAGNLTTAQLQALYNGTTSAGQPGPGQIALGNGHIVKACIMQAGSGTRSFWETALGVTDANVVTSTNATTCGSANEIEENSGNSFLARAQALGGTNVDYVIPMSAGAFASQANGAAIDQSANLRTAESTTPLSGLGEPDSVAPLTLSGGVFSPNTNYYQGIGTTVHYNRNMYVVVWTTKLGPTSSGGDSVIKSLFSGSTSAICSTAAQNTAHTFGFDSLTGTNGEPTCGATTTTGNN